jgi:hypothetical protein
VLTSFNTSLMEGRVLGSFCSSQRIMFRNSVVMGEAVGIFTCASMIFMISAHWLRASNGCSRVAHYTTNVEWIKINIDGVHSVSIQSLWVPRSR